MTNQSPLPTSSDPSRLTDLVNRGRLAIKLFMDPNVSAAAKAIPVLAILYLLSPIDLIPDFPIIGQIDDIAVLLIALRLFTDMAGQKVMGNASPEPDDHDAPISADYRVRDDTDM
jgi:uncharacterized membrane protein YkvA (DUF1232 family)